MPHAHEAAGLGHLAAGQHAAFPPVEAPAARERPDRDAGRSARLAVQRLAQRQQVEGLRVAPHRAVGGLGVDLARVARLDADAELLVEPTTTSSAVSAGCAR